MLSFPFLSSQLPKLNLLIDEGKQLRIRIGNACDYKKKATALPADCSMHKSYTWNKRKLNINIDFLINYE